MPQRDSYGRMCTVIAIDLGALQAVQTFQVFEPRQVHETEWVANTHLWDFMLAYLST